VLATVHAATLLGVRGHPVRVEVHVDNGLPAFNVVGLPDERWGQAVAAVVELNTTDSEAMDEEALNQHSRRVLAGYKVPKRILLVDFIQRGPNGKPDYGWAREVLEASS